MSDPIIITMNQDGSFDLPAIHVAPYVAPVAVDPPPVSNPTPVSQPPVSANPGVTADSVTLTGTLADGTAINVTAQKGQRVPLLPNNVNAGSLMYYADGLCACIENCYAGLTGDLIGTFHLVAGSTVLFDGPLTIWAYARTRPFWLTSPPLVSAPDMSHFPTYGAGSETATMKPQYDKADNGPLGIGCTIPGIGSGGERAQLGRLPQWDACYIVNPSADNAAVVRGMSDAACPWGFHAIDPATNQMLDVTKYARVSMLDVFQGIAGNPIAKYTSNTPLNLSQAWTHATAYCALAAAIYGTDFDREELALWANYIGGLWQNYSYRLPEGCTGTGGAARGKGRCLTVIRYAAKLSDRPAYFDAWVKAQAAAFNAAFPTQTGIQIDQKSAASQGYPDNGTAMWQQCIEIDAIGAAIGDGYPQFQPTFDCFAECLFDAMLSERHELLTEYTFCWKDASGNIAANWQQAMQFTAAVVPKVAAALQCAENSAALQAALGQPGNQPGDFWGPNDTADDGYVAMDQPAYAMLADHATDQTRAQAAYAKFMQYNRVDYSKNPKYNIVRRAA